MASGRSEIGISRTGRAEPRTENASGHLALETGWDVERPLQIFDERAAAVAERRALDRPGDDFFNRALNVVLAAAGLVIATPIVALFTVLVRLDSPGPIFYRQVRIGLDRRRRRSGDSSTDRRNRDLGGRPFMIYKFRTMRVDAEKQNGAVWATRGDARVTTLGRIMRKYRVDEIPQLVNVLLGDMNIVGPRPERPSIFSRLTNDVEDYQLRQRAKPGITGWAQINLTYDTSIDDVRKKVLYDLEYIERRGVTEDLRIMARTIPVMIFRKGGW